MFHRRLLSLWLVPLCAVGLANGAVPAVLPATTATTQPQGAAQEHFMRFVEGGADASKLQTAVVTYRNKEGVTIKLVAAIHIGERAYFESLNKLFTGCDSVLYEMVSPKNAESPTPKPGQTTQHPIARLQRFLQETLGLSYQLDVIDYKATNFVHADMDKETFEKMQAQRGESFESLMLQQMMAAMSRIKAQPADDDDAAPAAQDDMQELKQAIRLLTRPDGQTQMKIVLARQMGDMENTAMGLGGQGGTVIVTERNRAAFNVLKNELKAGRKNIAIFYGAAHMSDMADRLDLMGFAPVQTEWMTAWDLKINPNAPSALEDLIDLAGTALKDAGGNEDK